MERGEDYNFSVISLYFLVEFVNLSSLLEVLISEQEITD